MSTWCSSGGRPRRTDLATGCSTSGRLDGLTGLTPNVDVQGAINRTEITSRLPGYYEGTVPDERFGEAALNLSQILEDALGRRVLRVRLGVDALALVHVGAVEHAGLRGASPDHRALVLGLRRQVPRPRRGRRGAIPASPAFPGGSSGPTTTTTVLRTPPSRSGSRIPKVTTSSTTSVRRAGHTCSARPLRRRWGSVVRAVPAWRAVTRTTPRPAAPAPRPEASSAAAGGRSSPRPRPTRVSEISATTCRPPWWSRSSSSRAATRAVSTCS